MGIACQALGIAQQAYSLAEKYAEDRIQFGKKIKDLGPVKRLLEESNARVQGIRAMIYRASQMVDIHLGTQRRLQLEGVEEQLIRKEPVVAKWDKLAKIFTPLSKFTASELCCKVAYDAVQVHGGVGYTEEYEIAKVYRDARITSIYEGTTQLQVIAIIGGIVEGANDTSTLNKYLNEEIAGVEDSDMRIRLKGWYDTLNSLVVVYKEQEKEIKERIALEMVWHLSYLVMTLLVAQQVDIAAEVGHEILSEKKDVLQTLVLLTEAQVAAGKAYIESSVSSTRVEATAV